LIGGGIAQAGASAAGPAGSTNQDGGTDAAGIALDVLKSGLGVVPVVTALLGLFGGGSEEKPAPFVKYALPPSVAFDAAETSSGLQLVDRDQYGAARPYAGQAAIAPAAPQVNVTVNAMDARSFLDRSSEIAAAVREAMLNLNSINDVVNDL
jgi:hypothetical protein